MERARENEPTPAPRAASARDVLRRATHVAHEALERSVRQAPDLTLLEYTQTLRRFLRIHAALEPQLDAHGPAFARLGVDWPARRKVPLLRRDLDLLGVAALPEATREPPPGVPRLDELACALGCLYVLEGATLGGRLISTNLRRVLNLGPGDGAAFFNSYGAQVGERWRAFCVALELGLAEAPARDLAAGAAVATFRLFGSSLPRDA
jgi:heme oxygenase (biliverdin-IX-beta and delta-forming)